MPFDSEEHMDFNLRDRIRCAVFYLPWKSFVLRNKKQIVLGFDETVNLLLNGEKSVARYGDGELNLMKSVDHSLTFQRNSTELQKRLHEVFYDESPNLLIGIPHNVFRLEKTDNLRARAHWLSQITKISKYLDTLFYKERQFIDASFTRLYIDKKKNVDFDSRFKKVSKLWNNREVLIVEGENTKFGVGNGLLDNAKNVNRILIPNENAFDSYKKIYESTTSVVKNMDSNVLVLISAGPTATILAADLSKIGVQSIDIGHLDVEYEWFKRGVTEKVRIPGKYVNEAAQGRDLAHRYEGDDILLRVD